MTPATTASAIAEGSIHAMYPTIRRSALDLFGLRIAPRGRDNEAMRVYHFTLKAVAEAILAEGFRDGDPERVGETTHHGIWLADLDLARDGELGDDFSTLAVEVPEAELAPYEVKGNPMVKPGSHREWCVPAAVVNGWRVAVL